MKPDTVTAAPITWCDRPSLIEAVRAVLSPASVILDVGPGIRPQQLLPCYLYLGIEPYRPYLDALRQVNGDHHPAVLLHGTWDQAMPLLLDRSVDTVIAGDMIEHLSKAAGWAFLAEAQRVARQQVVLFTPLGFHPQDYHGRPDAWGMDGGHWQNHYSGWLPDEFGDGWQCFACADYHDTDDHGQRCEPFGAFYAIWSRQDA